MIEIGELLVPGTNTWLVQLSESTAIIVDIRAIHPASSFGLTKKGDNEGSLKNVLKSKQVLEHETHGQI